MIFIDKTEYVLKILIKIKLIVLVYHPQFSNNQNQNWLIFANFVNTNSYFFAIKKCISLKL